MGQKLVVGPHIGKGLRTDVLPFDMDNDSFPTLLNAYQWRGRIKRKRGTVFYGRLTRYLSSLSGSSVTINAGSNQTLALFTVFSLPSTSSFVSGNVTPITITIGGQALTDSSGTGTLTVAAGNITAATLNYSNGVLTYTATSTLAGQATVISANYYPGLPVLGLEPFVSTSSEIPSQIGFDTTYAYNIPTQIGLASQWFSVSFYYNSSIQPKATPTPVNWNLHNYQQMWTTNYAGALWAVPGIGFSPDGTVANVGMQFLKANQITSATQTSATTVDFVIPSTPLIVGDFVFANEFTGTAASTLNFQTGYVSNVAGTTYTVTFPNANIAATGLVPGILQYLTNSSDTTKDCIRWYNGSPVNSPTTPSFNQNAGWVNFAPPLLSSNVGSFSISNLRAGQYYLVGARTVVPYKDRLLFFGAIVQTSTSGPFYLQDTVIYSQNGTPYYTASFDASTNVPPSPKITYFPLLTPGVPNVPSIFQPAQPTAWWENITGFGGFINAGYARPITTTSINEDVLIVGFSDRQARLAYTGNDIVPFNFYIINSELGSDATFSSITLDRGVVTWGGRGIVITSQIGTQRIDLDILPNIFEVPAKQSNIAAICAQRDFINEWIQFTYIPSKSPWSFPTQTLQYNYRDNSWAIFNESYTTYGTIRTTTGLTWATVGSIYGNWAGWNDPWNSSKTQVGQPQIYAGNAQGFVLIKGVGTGEGNSLFIQSISGNQITSPNHCLNNGDYIVISGCLGTVASQVNGKVFQINSATTNTFNVDATPTLTGTYLGNGLIKRMYVPFIQSKQFPVSWDMARKTRIGVQQYLLTETQNGQITLLIYLSQTSTEAANYIEFPNRQVIVPTPGSQNNSLIYSSVLYTCMESTNLGLSPSNINLQMNETSDQIWHRMNTSLIGDTVQVGFSLNDAQMRDANLVLQFAEIELHSFILDVQPSSLLA